MNKYELEIQSVPHTKGPKFNY